MIISATDCRLALHPGPPYARCFMRQISDLTASLMRLDRKPYGALKSVRGAYQGPEFVLHIDHVQGDPFGEPSPVRLVVEAAFLALPRWVLTTALRREATADFLNRRFCEALASRSRSRGSGHSGHFRMQRPGQQILRRSSAEVDISGGVELRFQVGLPAQGRRISGHQACEMFAEDVPSALAAGVAPGAFPCENLEDHVRVAEDAQAFRAQLPAHGLVAWVGEGALLPRASGIDDRPLGAGAVPFSGPDALKVRLTAPHSGTVVGMGIPEGITLIVGGGYHGKSTLLRALERGVYDHIPGDGRERVVALESAVKIRAEDGRPVIGVNIANFIGELPGGRTTERFITANASGSTSQAAALAEALELGAQCLLIDEDTSATNFMIRDARMQALVGEENEPITPFIDRVEHLRRQRSVSSILVVGGSGDYFEVADTVIAMRDYRPADVTAQAKNILERHPTRRQPVRRPWQEPGPRRLDASSIDPSRGRKDVHIRAISDDRLLLGQAEIDLSAVEQLVERGQVQGVARALVWLREHGNGDGVAVGPWIDEVMSAVERYGLDVLALEQRGDLAMFRRFELAGALNRLRGLKVES